MRHNGKYGLSCNSRLRAESSCAARSFVRIFDMIHMFTSNVNQCAMNTRLAFNFDCRARNINSSACHVYVNFAAAHPDNRDSTHETVKSRFSFVGILNFSYGDKISSSRWTKEYQLYRDGTERNSDDGKQCLLAGWLHDLLAFVILMGFARETMSPEIRNDV